MGKASSVKRSHHILKTRLHSTSSAATSQPGSSENDADSLKENEPREDGIMMDLVTSVSTGSLMHQAMTEATAQDKRRPKRRKAAHRIPLHGE